jgi:hypothetical protein
MVAAPAPPAPAQGSKYLTTVLAAVTTAFAITTICLSIAIASDAGKTMVPAPGSSDGTKSYDVKVIEFPTTSPPPGENICKDAKKKAPLPEIDCIIQDINGEDIVNDGFALGTAEQSGRNVTKGHQGGLEVTTVPITGSYYKAGLCPVNVHWHAGTEHLSVGEYDENGKGPSTDDHDHRALADNARLGFRCHHYDETDKKFTEEYNWEHCTNTHVGETYEVHWPHSAFGACATVNQYQTPFYDGVFCEWDGSGNPASRIGVQGQVFTIVNDEAYYYPDLIRGMIVDGEFGSDIATYTGSTTGTKRNNDQCSQYTGITWQVDRKCHLISASSFDKMCADMKAQRDDMTDDLYPHGSRELVADHLASNNLQRRKTAALRGN